jgi:ABC-type multidrug transport system fused ATPase/permease subunit
VERETKRRDKRIGLEVDGTIAFDRIVFRLLVAAGVVTLVLAVVGVGLALGGVIAVAIVSGAVAILPGAGTVILFKLQAQLRKKRKDLDAQRERNANSLETLQAIVAIEDEEIRKRRFLQYVSDRRRTWVGAPTSSGWG